MSLPLLAAALFVVPFGGCVETPELAHEEALPGEEEAELGKADGGSGALWTYYAVVRRDERTCAAPACGGFWVKRLNQPDTKCADGKWRDECYISTWDWSRAGFSELDEQAAETAVNELRAVLRGKMLLAAEDGAALSVFRASEVWESVTSGAPESTVLRAASSRPCPSGACDDVRGTRLNKSGQAAHSVLRLAGPGLDPIRPALSSEHGVIAVGTVGADATFEISRTWQRRVHSDVPDDRTEGPACSPNIVADFPKGELRIHIIDVGQGDAIWVQTPWEGTRDESLDVLIDAGSSGLMPGSSPGGDVVVDYLLSGGLEEGDVLDAVVLTHAHDDHYGGLERVAESFGISRYVDSGFDGDTPSFAATRKIARERVEHAHGHMHVPAVSELVPRVFAGSDLFGPRVESTLLWAAATPPSGNSARPTGTDVNNTSIALALRYGGRQALLMGDVESAVEAALVGAHDAGEVDLTGSFLKVAHHGSSNSTSSEFLARVFPRRGADTWAAISSGRRTFSGAYLPTDATIDRLHAALPEGHVLSTENRDQFKVGGKEHGDDTVLVRIRASGYVAVCYVP